jgi:hypothetical protein
MKEIQLTKGNIAIVDDDTYTDLIQYRWCMAGGYAYNSRLGTMHRYLMKQPYNKGQRGTRRDQLQVDHINGDRLDNRLENLRLASGSENSLNYESVRGRSKYRGVIWAGSQKSLLDNDRPWIVRIKLPGQSRKYLGSFKTEEEAALAYNEYALEHCPGFTKLNTVNL